MLVRIQISRYVVSRKTRRYIASSWSGTRQAQHLGSLTGSYTTRDKPRVTCSYKRLSTHSRLNPNYFKHVYTELQNSLGKKLGKVQVKDQIQNVSDPKCLKECRTEVRIRSLVQQ